MMYEFKFPDVGEGVHEGTILEIKVSPGDKVEAGDVLAIVETDKVTAEIPSSKDGVIVKFGFEEGDSIEVGETLAYIDLGGSKELSEPPSGSDKNASSSVEENANVVGELDLGDGSIMASSQEGFDNKPKRELSSVNKKVLATPLARKIARDNNVDITEIIGTGPAGRVTKKNLMEVINSSPSTQNVAKVNIPLASDTVIPLSKLRQTISKNMTESSQIPSAVVHEEIFFDKIVDLRKQVNETIDAKISYLPIIIKALSFALRKYPEFNATFNAEKQIVTQHIAINIGIAMDNGGGLFVPVINNTDTQRIEHISNNIKSYIDKVSNNKIEISEMRGGTFTVSNYGVEGGLFASPLILPPQVAILGIGRVNKRPVVINDEIKAGHVLPVSLVIDHRVIDGAAAGKFLTYLRMLLENPHILMMEMV